MLAMTLANSGPLLRGIFCRRSEFGTGETSCDCLQPKMSRVQEGAFNTNNANTPLDDIYNAIIYRASHM